MHAVFLTGGKQYRVTEGDRLKVEKLPGEVGDSVDFDRVLMVNDGEAVTVGTPYIEGGKVVATVRAQGRAPKVEVVKMRRRKYSRKRTGHRQAYTEVEITGIAAG